MSFFGYESKEEILVCSGLCLWNNNCIRILFFFYNYLEFEESMIFILLLLYRLNRFDFICKIFYLILKNK